MKILITADPELPVPPKYYGGIERIVDMLVRGLIARGHEVTLFAHRDSSTGASLVPWPGRSSLSGYDTVCNSALLTSHVLFHRVDIIHSFSRVAYLLPLLPLPIPKLMTYQRPIAVRSVKMGHRLSNGTLWFTAISHQMMTHVSDVGTWRVVFNGIPLSAYEYSEDPGVGAPLLFLGRIEEIKGPHLAIEIARRSDLPLVVAGNVPPEHYSWYAANVAPYIDGVRVRYVGPVDDKQKNDLFRSALALLMPIVWDEPFGIVMAEAMACGTPVIGFNRGAVPEVVDDGKTGFVVDTVDECVEAVKKLGTIDRKCCCERVKRLFSDKSVIDGYLTVYAEMLGGL